jgi:O-antigen ligase
MNRDTLDKWSERGILGLVLAILVFGPLATGAVRTPDFLVIQGLTIGVLLLWCLRLWLKPHPQFLFPPICWLVVAFALYSIARYKTADIEYVARMEMVRVLVYAFLFLAILNNLYRQEHSQIITFTLIFLAMAISFYAVYQFVTNSDKVWTFVKPYEHRGSGTYISPNNLAGFLEMILPLGLAWMLVSRARTLTKVFIGYASLAILAGVAVTVSRGGWLSVGLSLIVFFALLFFHRSYRLPSAALLAVIIAAGFYFIPRTQFFQERLNELTKNGGINDNSRFELWGPAVKLWQENIWWGIGPDHFNYRFRPFRPETIQREPDRVHNDYLNTLVDWGIVGTALVASAWVLLCAGIFKTWRFVRGSPNDLASRKSNKFAMVLGASLGLLALLVHSTVDFNLHVPANAILAVSLMALLSSCLRFTSEKYWLTARAGVKVVVTLVLLSGAFYLGGQGFRRLTEYAWLARAQNAPGFSAQQISLLEKAFAVEPKNFETAFSIGQAFRVESWEGDNDYKELAGKAMDWFDRAIKLNPYYGYSFMQYGMCLDWLGRFDEGQSYFDRAVLLDPNGYFTAAHMGWHYVQKEDYAAAKTWFERSERLLGGPRNPIANSYLPIVERKLVEIAASRPDSNP